jgi:hypothetical protein
MIDKQRRPIYKIRRDNLLYFYKHWSGDDGVKTWQALSKLAAIDRTKLSGAVSNTGIIIGDSYADKLEKALGLQAGILDIANKAHSTEPSAELLDKIHEYLIPLLEEMQITITEGQYAELVFIAADHFKGTGTVSLRVLRQLLQSYLTKSL